jgi:hypothetical protein
VAERLFCCPYCPCVFVSAEDLRVHLQAFIVRPAPVNCGAVNRGDHVRLFRETHKRLEFGGFCE